MHRIILLINCSLCLLLSCYSCKKDVPATNSTNSKTGSVIDGNNAVIDKDTEWKDIYGGDTIDYYVEKPVRITKNAVLTIHPGVKIAFESKESGIRVEENAGLNASGTPEKQIVLTSRKLNSGAWRGITFASNNSSNKLYYTRVLYAGAIKDSGYCDSLAAIVLAKNCPVKATITHTYIAYSGGYGIWGASVNADLTFGNDSLICNLAPPLAITADNMDKPDSSSNYGYSSFAYVEVTGGEIKTSDTIQRLTVPYRINGRVHVTDTLTIMPGCVFEFNTTGELTTSDASGTNHNGIIKAIGTASSYIIFRGVQQQPGSWVGITITSPGDNELKYCDISYGGGAGGYQNPSSARGNIIVGRTATGAKAIIQRCKISNSAAYGIAMFKDNIVPDNSSIVSTTVKIVNITWETNTYDNNLSGNKGTY